jgi:hypothetical protein
MDRDLRWFAMPVAVQISNVGSEVNRAIKYKSKGETEKAERFMNKAIQLLELSKQDPKNRHRRQEFECAIEELIDYFIGNNIYQKTDEVLLRYYDAFLSRI